VNDSPTFSPAYFRVLANYLNDTVELDLSSVLLVGGVSASDPYDVSAKLSLRFRRQISAPPPLLSTHAAQLRSLLLSEGDDAPLVQLLFSVNESVSPAVVTLGAHFDDLCSSGVSR
jgi:hypothetical protein